MSTIISDVDVLGPANAPEPAEFHLLIDDLKDLGVENVARTAADGKRMLVENNVSHLYIDHDLGEKESGYDIINWAIENNVLPNWIQIVSYNPVGRINIERALKNQGFVQVKGFWIR